MYDLTSKIYLVTGFPEIELVRIQCLTIEIGARDSQTETANQ